MNRSPYAAVTLLTASLASLAATVDPAPRLVWNATASAPIGLYRVSPGRKVAVGDLALIMPDPALGQWLARRHYVPLGVPLIKPVAARAGQTFCRKGVNIALDGQTIARARPADRAGRPLPAWTGCRRLGPNEILLLSRHVGDSLDGRYFGPTPAAAVVGTVHPLLTRERPGTALVWHGWRS